MQKISLFRLPQLENFDFEVLGCLGVNILYSMDAVIFSLYIKSKISRLEQSIELKFGMADPISIIQDKTKGILDWSNPIGVMAIEVGLGRNSSSGPEIDVLMGEKNKITLF